MPHINLKHFPRNLTDEQRAHLADELTAIVTKHFEVGDGAVSIALEPVSRTSWNQAVVVPELTIRRHLLIKAPNYGAA